MQFQLTCAPLASPRQASDDSDEDEEGGGAGPSSGGKQSRKRAAKLPPLEMARPSQLRLQE